MHELISIVAGIAVMLGWIAAWAYLFQARDFVSRPKTEDDRARKRERMQRLGKFRHILMFGVLGPGLAFGLGLSTADFLADSHSWGYSLFKVMFMSVLFGWMHGARTWSETFPVPFPPDYPPPKVPFPPNYPPAK